MDPSTSEKSCVVKTKTPRAPRGMQAKRERDKARAKTQINIGRAFPLWRKLRARKGFKSDPQLAFYLLRACGEYPSQDVLNATKRKRGKTQKSTLVLPVQGEECQRNLFESIQDQQSTDGATRVSEIRLELSPASETAESEQTELKTEDDKRDLDGCMVYVSPALHNEDVPQSSSSRTTTEGIKKEPLDVELQTKEQLHVEDKLNSSTSSVETSEKISHSCVQTSAPVTGGAELNRRPLMPKKSPSTGLFSVCLQCGEPVLEYTVVSSGSLNRLQWKCSMGHLMWLFPNNHPT